MVRLVSIVLLLLKVPKLYVYFMKLSLFDTLKSSED